MKIIFMHKDIPVGSFDIVPNTGRISSELIPENPEHLPIPVQYADDQTYALANWIRMRSISKSREDLAMLLSVYRVETPEALSFKNLGLNLSDQYWFQPEGADLQYDEVNLFIHDFEPIDLPIHHLSSFSPDSSSNGNLRKYWEIGEDSIRYLYKAGSRPFFQQPYNEVAAARILDLLEVPHVPYSVVKRDGEALSVCPTFIDPDTEYIPALDILGVSPQKKNESAFRHFQNCVKQLAIPMKPLDIPNLIAFDYLIQNSDRHYGNFGFLRDANTLAFKGMAPVFDNGSSLWYMDLTQNMRFKDQPAKPFRDTQEKQLKLAEGSALPLENLSDDKLEQIVEESYLGADNVDTKRQKTILKNLKTARDYLKSQQSHWMPDQSIQH